MSQYNIIEENALGKSWSIKAKQSTSHVPRQLHGGKGKDTSTPNFIRLVLMRLIYGIASSMGIEDRLEDTFNGALIPPSADDALEFDEYGEDSDGLLGNIFSGN